MTLAADLSRTTEKGAYTGSVVAGAGGSRLADTEVGVSTEDEPRHLVIKPTGRDGEPMAGEIGLLREGDPAGAYYDYISFDGESVDALVPDGTYSVWMWGEVQGTHGPDSRGVALLSAPTVTVTKDTTVELKAAATREIQAITPQATANAQVRLDYHRSLGGTATVTDAFVIPRYYDSIWVTPGLKARDGELSVTARWRKVQPTLAIEDGRTAFDDLIALPGSALPADGTQKIQAVFAGTGTASEFAKVDVKNKIAVVRRNDLDDQVESAENAGAAVLLVVNDEPGRYFDATSKTALTVASLTEDSGESLIAQLAKGPVSLRVTSHPTTNYLYDLVRY